MNHRLCVCEYRNPIEFVCTHKECPDQRLICKSCAWDHKQHNSKVLQIKEFETMITNDSLVQRIQDVQNAEGINNSIEQLIQIAQADIMQILKKRCIELKDKIKKSHNPFNKAVDHIANISKKCYTSWTIDSLVKELDISDIQGQLQRMEATQFQKFSLICKEILILSDALDKLRKACQEEASLELKSIRNYIQQNLEVKEIKQRSLCDQDFIEIKKPSVQQEKYPIIWSSQILNQQQQQQLQQQQQQNYLDNKKGPKHMYQSHLHIINQPKELQEKALPYNNGRLKTEYASSKPLYDLLSSENKSRKCLFLDQKQEELKNQSNFYSNTDRQLSQSLYESSKKKS